MKVDRRVLEDVASGRLSPREAVRLLDARLAPMAAKGVRVRSTYQVVDVVGDPGVAEVLVLDGAYGIQRDGDVLVVSDSASGGFRFAGLPSGRRLALRVNPELALDVELTGASLSVWGVRATVRVGIQAATGSLEGVCGRLDLRLVSGSARVAGAPEHGDWRIRAESGSLEILLDAAVDAEVSVSARHCHVDVLGSDASAVLGSGSRLIEVDAIFSDVIVRRR